MNHTSWWRATVQLKYLRQIFKRVSCFRIRRDAQAAGEPGAGGFTPNIFSYRLLESHRKSNGNIGDAGNEAPTRNYDKIYSDEVLVEPGVSKCSE
jgi:hypothetical protein